MLTIMEKVTFKFFGQIIKIFVIFNVSRVQSQSPEDTDFLNFTVIADPRVRYYTQDYNRMCPYTEMCDVLVDVDPSVLGTDTEGPCCGKCECGNDCLNTRNCCPDRLPRLLTSGEVKAVYDDPVQCIHAQFRAYDQRRYNGKSYFMVTRCADDYFDKDVINNCQLEYEDFDLVNDIPNFLPVTDKTENRTYKNKYCANCNHAFDSNLVYWEAKIGIFKTDVKIQGLADIQMLFRMDPSSNLVFEKPPQLWYVEFIELCDAYIDRCNVTGLWDIKNPDIESMCVSYLSQYKGYKNIHCYICNGFSEITVELICDKSLDSGWRPKSFISLLDFNDLESDRQPQDPVADTSCEDNQQYDTWAVSYNTLFI